MAETLTINNSGSNYWEVTNVNGASITVDTSQNNPTIALGSVGTRYIFYNDGYSTHPIEFLDANNERLLSQSDNGGFEASAGVNWVDNGSSVEFTLTQDLSDELMEYRCTVHTAAMKGLVDSPSSVDYTPSTGSVSILSPNDGDTVDNPVTVDMDATNFTIEPASNDVTDGAGHFHILVNQPKVTPGERIPADSDNGYYHYGGGASTADLNLSQGQKTIRVQLGDANHRAYDITTSIDVDGQLEQKANVVKDHVFYQHGDEPDAANFAQAHGSTSTGNYIASGLGLINPDYQTETIDVKQGVVVIQRGDYTTASPNIDPQEKRKQTAHPIQVDRRNNVPLYPSGTTHIFVSLVSGIDDSVEIVTTNNKQPPNDLSFKIGEVDVDSQNASPLWNYLSDGGTLTFPTEDAADEVAERLSSGTVVYVRNKDSAYVVN